MKIVYLSENDGKDDSGFLELLYDERLAAGTFWIPEAEFREAGGWNGRLKAKRQYELLLRLADRYTLTVKDAEEAPEEGYIRTEEPEDAVSPWDGIYTDCYIIAKYKDKLLSNSCFDETAGSVLLAAGECGMQQEAAALLEKMLKRGREYYEIDDAVSPILIYKGSDVCFNILNVFAEQFGTALERMGKRVEYFDLETEEHPALAKYIGKHFQAVIGMQTYAFSIKLRDDKTYLHDLMIGPKFNYIFDHPIWEKSVLTNAPESLHVLTHDLYYVDFCRQHYHKKSHLFPPASDLPVCCSGEKQYAITFVGTCGNYWDEVRLIHQMDRNVRFLASRFLLKMRKEPNLTAEEAFRRALEEKRIPYTEDVYMDLFFQCRRVIYCVMHYHRQKVIRTLLESGLCVNVFGNSWKNSSLAAYPNLVCHPDVTVEESLAVFAASKISLNIMSWHKGGFTERMTNIMLYKAVLLTDDTAYLDGKFRHGRDLLVFRLDRLEELPDMVKKYLDAPEKLHEIAQNGFEKVKAYHTWDSRAKEFLEIIMGDTECSGI